LNRIRTADGCTRFPPEAPDGTAPRRARGAKGLVGGARWMRCAMYARIVLALLTGPAVAGLAAAEAPPEPEPARLAEYQARRPKSVTELQIFRRSEAIAARRARGKPGRATLTNLQPHVNAWFLLTLAWPGAAAETYHLENPDPSGQRLRLDPSRPSGLLLQVARTETGCDLWGDRAAGIAAAKASRLPYAPLCEGRVYLRNPVEGRRTALEWATDFLRDYVWNGERITTFVRETFFQDAFLATSDVLPGVAGEGDVRHANRPEPAQVDPRYAGHTLIAQDFGLVLDNPAGRRVRVGSWYPLKDNPGIFASVIQPGLVSPEVIKSQAGRVNALDAVESDALVYLVAFDLAHFELGFALGTEHPRLEWSDRVRAAVRAPALPGPDGFADARPLVRTGLLPPELVARVAATFTGGFKRTHGGFRHGDLAARNSGSHYGFVEHGVVFSKLVPGLSTVVVDTVGEVSIATWQERDPASLWNVRHARQNGVAILEPDPQTRAPRPSALVRNWGRGNWSGSKDNRLRSLRAGVCLQEPEGRRFLIYGYFSTATPSAMARVFQAYGCRYAMHLDMNALEHTYLAVYRLRNGTFATQHLVEGMSVLDKPVKEQELPRFVAYADNRDFFYLVRRSRE
jgi:hypothetical protein